MCKEYYRLLWISMLWPLSSCYCGLDQAVYHRIWPNIRIWVPARVAASLSYEAYCWVVPENCVCPCLSHTRIHILWTNSMLYVGLTVNFTVFFFNTFINKGKHGQNTLPLLGRIKVLKRMLMVLNVGIHKILNFLVLFS